MEAVACQIMVRVLLTSIGTKSRRVEVNHWRLVDEVKAMAGSVVIAWVRLVTWIEAGTNGWCK